MTSKEKNRLMYVDLIHIVSTIDTSYIDLIKKVVDLRQSKILEGIEYRGEIC